VYLPLEHEAGDAIQFDWGDMNAFIGETRIPVSVLCAVLPYSGTPCAFVYHDKTILSFLHGHIRVFEYYGGVSRRCVYDNLRTAVKYGSGKNAVKQDDFRRVEAHYGFEAVFCNAYSGFLDADLAKGPDDVFTVQHKGLAAYDRLLGGGEDHGSDSRK
jgi:transposase